MNEIKDIIFEIEYIKTRDDYLRKSITKEKDVVELFSH